MITREEERRRKDEIEKGREEKGEVKGKEDWKGKRGRGEVATFFFLMSFYPADPLEAMQTREVEMSSREHQVKNGKTHILPMMGLKNFTALHGK